MTHTHHTGFHIYPPSSFEHPNLPPNPFPPSDSTYPFNPPSSQPSLPGFRMTPSVLLAALSDPKKLFTVLDHTFAPEKFF